MNNNKKANVARNGLSRGKKTFESWNAQWHKKKTKRTITIKIIVIISNNSNLYIIRHLLSQHKPIYHSFATDVQVTEGDRKSRAKPTK